MEDKIIIKAIEGGYGSGKLQKRGLGWCYPSNNESVMLGFVLTDIGRMVLEIDFWKALSKACKWRDISVEMFDGRKHKFMGGVLSYTYFEGGAIEYKTGKPEIYYAMRFHEINLTGDWGKAVKFLIDLIKNKHE